MPPGTKYESKITYDSNAYNLNKKVMDYEKKYKDAMARLELVTRTGLKLDPTYIFPELAESEDERIRKEIIDIIKSQKEQQCHIDAAIYDKMIAWLEKQGEPNPYSGTSFEYNGHHWGMCARDNGVEIIFDGELKAFLSSEKSFIYPIHLQSDITPKSAMEAIKEEKVDNQNCVKPAKKVGPKFKVGDWITNGDYTWKIIEVKPLDYILQSQDGNIVDDTISYVDKQFHLWSIEDAKDGDILALDNENCPFIYKAKTVFENPVAYCGVRRDGLFISGSPEDHYWCPKSEVIPATKEQRDLLFQKMKEAGYEWNKETKELKKISQRIVSAKSKEAVFNKSTWSEEDDAHQRDAIYAVEHIYSAECGGEELVDWLKSLKERLKGE